MAEDGLSVTLPLPMDVPSRVINLLSLPSPSLYLVFRGRWPDLHMAELAYGVSGVWALGPKLGFQLATW
jgi:hypothetical protein